MDMPYKTTKALMYTILLWVIGFVWGSIVFMTPAFKAPAIPYISSNPAISFPIMVLWLIFSYLLAKNYLKQAAAKVAEGMKLGLTFAVVNALLDLVVLVLLLAGPFTKGRVRLFCFGYGLGWRT